MRKWFVALLFAPIMAFAQMELAEKLLENPQHIGTGARTVFFVHIYDAHLYAPNGHWQMDKPFVLSLKHTRDVEKHKIIDKTFESMRDAGFKDKKKMAVWRAKLNEFMSDVKEGDVSTYYRDAKGHTVFYKNNKRIGTMSDEQFTQAYFNIWLSKKSPLSGMYKGLLQNNK